MERILDAAVELEKVLDSTGDSDQFKFLLIDFFGDHQDYNL